jgi:hypothetical protein
MHTGVFWLRIGTSGALFSIYIKGREFVASCRVLSSQERLYTIEFMVPENYFTSFFCNCFKKTCRVFVHGLYINRLHSRLLMFHPHPISQWPEWLMLISVSSLVLLNIGVDIVDFRVAVANGWC